MSGTGHCSAKSSSSCSSKLLLSSSLYRTRSRNDGDRAMQRRCGASASTSGSRGGEAGPFEAVSDLPRRGT
ncbi:hypothetical protein MUK42_21240 [Musa troglodytarum]|uniref:Uncharacterized protein n=1 Tax=Musa troglodytarum TaxID=320322 RepID=A0A9E7FRF8_9LILI|nr:hypothetical protein MUK42_21240 [Musa troglodytarum]URE00630.1 hypothetical protein MUK42_21240 [Musa troglodytarum]